MKLFKSLLIAPATLGLLAPMSAISSEVDFQAISKYSNAEYDLDADSFKKEIKYLNIRHKSIRWYLKLL